MRRDTIIHHNRGRKLTGTRHVCAWCQQRIAIGLPVIRSFGINMSDAWMAIFHNECWRAESDWWADPDNDAPYLEAETGIRGAGVQMRQIPIAQTTVWVSSPFPQHCLPGAPRVRKGRHFRIYRPSVPVTKDELRYGPSADAAYPIARHE